MDELTQLRLRAMQAQHETLTLQRRLFAAWDELAVLKLSIIVSDMQQLVPPETPDNAELQESQTS